MGVKEGGEPVKKLVLFIALGLIAADSPPRVPAEKIAAHSAKLLQYLSFEKQATTRLQQLSEQVNRSLAALQKESGVASDCRLRLEDEGQKGEDKMGTWACPEPKVEKK